MNEHRAGSHIPDSLPPAVEQSRGVIDESQHLAHYWGLPHHPPCKCPPNCGAPRNVPAVLHYNTHFEQPTPRRLAVAERKKASLVSKFSKPIDGVHQTRRWQESRDFLSQINRCSVRLQQISHGCAVWQDSNHCGEAQGNGGHRKIIGEGLRDSPPKMRRSERFLYQSDLFLRE